MERCQRVASAIYADILVSACQMLGTGVNLYLTSQSSYKPWTLGPFMTEAYSVTNLQVAGDIVMVTDSSRYPQNRYGKPSVHLFSLEMDS
jgi:hypothetical protein